MYINSLHMKNFKCFRDDEIHFNSRFNLIVGNNGVGKTSILEAVAIGISGYLNEIKSLLATDRRNITQDDVSIQRNTISELTEFQPVYPVELDFKVDINGEEYRYSRFRQSKSDNTRFDHNSQIKECSKVLNSVLVEGKKEILPAFVYHGTGRVWARASKSSKIENVSNRDYGYRNCINPLSNENQYSKWIEEMRRYEIDEDVVSSELRALCATVERFLGEGSKIRYSIKEKQIIITLPDGRTMPFDKLSDGYKNAIGIVCDTAFRIIKLNPWLKERAIEETPGIMLIDEIDLHLHPSWQKKIVSDLKNTFPKLQIIATTHAPIVVSSCTKDEIIMLDAKVNENMETQVSISYPYTGTKGWLAENILIDIMGINTSRDQETEEQIEEFKSIYQKKFSNGLSEKEANKFAALKKILEDKLPSEDPIITLIGFEAYEKSLEE